MGLITLPGTQLQYFSFSEEILVLIGNALQFTINIAPGWLLLITGLSTVFIIAAVFYRIAKEMGSVGS